MISSLYKGQALITFTYDDGRRNNYETALPLHEEFGIPAVFAIIADRMQSPEFADRYMTGFEVADASRRGVEIASHSLTHTERLIDVDNATLRRELHRSKEMLSPLVPRDAEVTSFCVPFSKADSRVTDAASSLYRFVRIDGKKLNDVSGDSALVSSHPVRNDTTIEEIKVWIDRAVREKRWLVLMFHGIVPNAGSLARYDAEATTLSAILEYVRELSVEELLPVNFAQAASVRAGSRGRRAASAFVGARPSQTVLADAPGHLITYHRNSAPTDKLIISFGGLPSKKTATGFGSKFSLNQGWDHIFVAQEAMTQYQQLSIAEFQDAVSLIASEYDVFTYGSSLGAYAALYYGGSVNARIISAAPKNSAHPLVLQKRFAHLGFHHQELKDVPRSVHQPVVLFDPHRRDEARFIQKLVVPAYPDLHLVELPYAGHTVLETMKQMGSLKPFIEAYVERHELIDVAVEEGGLSVFPAERGRAAFGARDYERALSLFRQSLELGFNAEAGAGEIKSLLRLGHVEGARSAAREYAERNGSLRGIPEWARHALS